MSVEGRLNITLNVKDGGVSAVEIVSTRPKRIASFFVGKSPAQAVSLMPSLFSICGTAQTAAALEACEQALGVMASPEASRARQIAIWFETAREHITRVAMDWGRPQSTNALKAIMPVAQSVRHRFSWAFKLGGLGAVNAEELAGQMALLESYLETDVFGQPCDTWLKDKDISNWSRKSEAQAGKFMNHLLERGWAGIGAAGVLMAIPNLPNEDLACEMREEGFTSLPSWQGNVYETTTLTRCLGAEKLAQVALDHGNGLFLRLSGLLVELAGIPGKIKTLLSNDYELLEKLHQPGQGLAQVEAARGRLAHSVSLEDGIIEDYRILAPTEWNFHPEGCAAKALSALKAEDDETLLEQASHIICAIDPCVAFDMRIT